MRRRDVFATFVGIGSGILVIDGGFAVYGLSAAYQVSPQDLSWIAEARALFTAVLVEGMLGVVGVALFIGLFNDRQWATRALPWAAASLAILAAGVLIAMPNTWHHQIPIALGCAFVIAFRRYAWERPDK